MMYKEAKSDEFLEVGQTFWKVYPRSVRNGLSGFASGDNLVRPVERSACPIETFRIASHPVATGGGGGALLDR